MSIVDFIGFIVAFVAMVILFIRRKAQERKRLADPEGYAKSEGESGKTLEEFLRSMEGEDLISEEEPPPRPLPQKRVIPPRPPAAKKTVTARPKAKEIIKGSYADYKQESSDERKEQALALENRKLPNQPFWDMSTSDSYQVIRKTKTPRGLTLIRELPSQRDMLIIKEIFDRPLSMRVTKDQVKDSLP